MVGIHMALAYIRTHAEPSGIASVAAFSAVDGLRMP